MNITDDGFTVVVLTTRGFAFTTTRRKADALGMYRTAMMMTGTRCVAVYCNNKLIDMERMPEFRQGDKGSRDFAESLRTIGKPTTYAGHQDD